MVVRVAHIAQANQNLANLTSAALQGLMREPSDNMNFSVDLNGKSVYLGKYQDRSRCVRSIRRRTSCTELLLSLSSSAQPPATRKKAENAGPLAPEFVRHMADLRSVARMDLRRLHPRNAERDQARGGASRSTAAAHADHAGSPGSASRAAQPLSDADAAGRAASRLVMLLLSVRPIRP